MKKNSLQSLQFALVSSILKNFVISVSLFLSSIMVVHLFQNKVEKKIFFFEEIVLVFAKYTLFAEKNFLYGKKSFILKKFFTERNFFYREKH